MQESARPRIAYLAPEIPGPSSTFVYNEILELEKLGIEVVPYSLHRVTVQDSSAVVRRIASNCSYLYGKGIISLILSQFTCIIRRPSGYFFAFKELLKDCLKNFTDTQRAAGLLYRFFIGAYLANKLAKKQITKMHCHFAHISADVAMYASVINGSEFSITAHANDLFERGYLLKEKSIRSKFIATISNYNIEFLKSIGIHNEKIQLVRCGVDAEIFQPRTFKPIPNIPVIGFLGRLVEKKGVDLLIEAVSILKAKGIQFRLVIAGTGPLEAELRMMAANLNVDSQTEFIGSIPHNEVPLWFDKIDIFVLPAKIDTNGDQDGIPVVLMEAMVRRVPVVSTRISGIPELVIDMQTGILTDAYPKSIADAIELLISEDETQIRQRIDRAESLVKSEFSLKANAYILATLMNLNMSLKQGKAAG